MEADSLGAGQHYPDDAAMLLHWLLDAGPETRGRPRDSGADAHQNSSSDTLAHLHKYTTADAVADAMDAANTHGHPCCHRHAAGDSDANPNTNEHADANFDANLHLHAYTDTYVDGAAN